MDMKYKKLNPAQRNFSLQESDSYQMLAYANAFECDQVLLIFPQPGPEPIQARFTVRNQDVDLRIAGVNLHQQLNRSGGLVEDFKKIFAFLN